MTTEQITEALIACELEKGLLAVNGACPLHGGDNCLARFDRVRDWVSCPTCGGAGRLVDRNRTGDLDYYDTDPCPDCVGGLVPSAELIERVVQVLIDWEQFRDWHVVAKAVLLASRREDTHP